MPVTICYMVLLVFFFFQAEDGIRDVAVTGVQTCALPILVARWDAAGLSHLASRRPDICGRSQRRQSAPNPAERARIAQPLSGLVEGWRLDLLCARQASHARDGSVAHYAGRGRTRTTHASQR